MGSGVVGPGPTVLRDLAAAVAVWRSDVRLPVLSVVVTVASEGPRILGGGLAPAGPVVGFFLAGWVGAVLVWYRRAFAGSTVTVAELRCLCWAFLGRFLVLGILGAVPLLAVFPLRIAGGVVGGGAWVLVAALVAAAVAFVGPALAFTTRQVSVGVPLGLRLAHDDWPRTAPYALLAAASGVVLQPLAFRGHVGVAVALAGLVPAALLHLAVTGAFAAWYLRHGPTGPDGAAYHDQTPLP